MAELFDAVTGWKELEEERTEKQFLAARRIAWSVFKSVGAKVREEEIWPLDIDEREKERLIKEFGFAKVTQVGNE